MPCALAMSIEQWRGAKAKGNGRAREMDSGSIVQWQCSGQWEMAGGHVIAPWQPGVAMEKDMGQRAIAGDNGNGHRQGAEAMDIGNGQWQRAMTIQGISNGLWKWTMAMANGNGQLNGQLQGQCCLHRMSC